MPNAVTTPTAPSRILQLRLGIRLVRARVQGLFGVARLLGYALVGRVDEVWIGDSHVVHVNSPTMVTALRRLPDGRWIWHLGPRIMYSIAREGLPPALLRTLELISRTRRAKDIVWVFSFGEIDVRCHLAPRLGKPDAFAFVARYLERLQRAATRAGARRTLVLIPPPVSEEYPEQAGFPVVGTFAERVDANRALRDALIKAAAGLPADGAALHLIDVTEEFSDGRGGVKDGLTFDGLHTNEAGRAVIRKRVEEILAETA